MHLDDKTRFISPHICFGLDRNTMVVYINRSWRSRDTKVQRKRETESANTHMYMRDEIERRQEIASSYILASIRDVVNTRMNSQSKPLSSLIKHMQTFFFFFFSSSSSFSYPSSSDEDATP